MRVVWTLGVAAGLFAAACVPMKTLRGSTATYLTSAGSRVTISRPGGTVAGTVQEIFSERGLLLVNRFQVSPANVVLFFRGARMIPGSSMSRDPVWASAASEVGSWFAVRIADDGSRSIVTFFGKPTVNGTEICGDGDDQFRDARYACIDVRVREDWPAGQLVEGREETEVISGIISTLTERLPER